MRFQLQLLEEYHIRSKRASAVVSQQSFGARLPSITRLRLDRHHLDITPPPPPPPSPPPRVMAPPSWLRPTSLFGARSPTDARRHCFCLDTLGALSLSLSLTSDFLTRSLNNEDDAFPTMSTGGMCVLGQGRIRCPRGIEGACNLSFDKFHISFWKIKTDSRHHGFNPIHGYANV